MPTLLLDGFIETLQPVTVSVPNDNAMTKGIHMMPFFDNQAGRVLLPCLTGANIRGALRSKGGVPALAEVYGADPADPMTWGVFTIPQIYNASSGGLVLKDTVSAEDLLDARDNRKRDIHNSLFGAMRLKMKGQLEVDFAKPDIATYLPQQVKGQHYGARRDVYRQEPSLLNRHPQEEIDGFQAFVEGNKELSALRTKIKGVETKIAAHGKRRGKDAADSDPAEVKALRDELAELQKKRDELQKKGDSIGRTLDPLDYIAAGVKLTHGMRVINAEDAAIGYFLRCLAHFSNECRLGGHAATGFGQVRMEYRLRIREGMRTEDAGSLTVAPYEFGLESDHPAIARAQTAFEEAAKDRENRFSLNLKD